MCFLFNAQYTHTHARFRLYKSTLLHISINIRLLIIQHDHVFQSSHGHFNKIHVVSIYVDKITTGNDVFEGIMQKGAMNIFGLLLSGHQVTVVGEVPANTVEMIAHSVAMIE